MPIGDYNPVPKPKHKRRSKTAKQRGQVTKAVYAAAWERAGGRCERCGRYHGQVWTLEAAHVERRWRFGQEGVKAEDIVILCGPSTDSRTCHHWADYTREGREWLLRKREEFLSRKESQTIRR
jgi:hypothetical protein